MKYVIVKWWPSAPQLRQRATLDTFTDRSEAERVKAELEVAMPGRCFAVESAQSDSLPDR